MTRKRNPGRMKASAHRPPGGSPAGLQRPRRRRSDRDHAAAIGLGARDRCGRGGRNLRPLRLHAVFAHVVGPHRQERCGPDRQRQRRAPHARRVERSEQRRGEVQSRRRRGDRAAVSGKDGLVPIAVERQRSGRAPDVRRQRQFAMLRHQRLDVAAGEVDRVAPRIGARAHDRLASIGKRNAVPARKRFAGRPRQLQTFAPRCATTSSSAAPPPAVRQCRRAARTRVSLKISRSPGRSSCGRLRTPACRSEETARSRTSKRAASRSAAGVCAISSGGRCEVEIVVGQPKGRARPRGASTSTSCIAVALAARGARRLSPSPAPAWRRTAAAGRSATGRSSSNGAPTRSR